MIYILYHTVFIHPQWNITIYKLVVFSKRCVNKIDITTSLRSIIYHSPSCCCSSPDPSDRVLPDTGIIFDMLSIIDPPPSECCSVCLSFFSLFFPLMAVRLRPRAAVRSPSRSPPAGATSSFFAFLSLFLCLAFFSPALEAPPAQSATFNTHKS